MTNYEERRNVQRAEGSRQFQFVANKSLTERLESIISQRGGNISKALRLLLWLAVEEYEVNRLAGVTTKRALQEQQSVRRANAEAIAAEREMKRKGKGKTPLPAASAMLITECEQAVAPHTKLWMRMPLAEPSAGREWGDLPLHPRHSNILHCKNCGNEISIPIPEFEPGITALANRAFCCEKCSPETIPSEKGKEAPNAKYATTSCTKWCD